MSSIPEKTTSSMLEDDDLIFQEDDELLSDAMESDDFMTSPEGTWKVLVVDDLLATGGTAEAGIKLIEVMGGDIIGCAFIVDLPELGGRSKIEALGFDVHVLCEFEGA